MLRCRDKSRGSPQGGTFVTSLIFLFLLIGMLRLCSTVTLHEAKLTSIFVQETQGFYLLENLMHLARDYAYQIVQNPREPHLFLSASAYRTKDKISFKKNDGTYNDGWVTDFNGSLSKQQIVPDDFPLQIFDNGWEIRGGPIFWQDNKKNENDERYLAEVFMVGSLHFTPNLIPDWTMYTVQTMEIERNPLCDFQLYAEGDITINTNIGDNSTGTYITGPVQINGNARFSDKNGFNDNFVNFYNKVNCAGHALKIDGNSLDAYKLPLKYHMFDNCENYQKTPGSGIDTFFISANYNMEQLSYGHNNFDNSNYDSYERYAYDKWLGNFNTRSRVYRPIGFDPINYWGFWEPSSTTPAVGDGIDQDKQVLNYCFGFHNLAQGSARGAGLFSRKAKKGNYSPQYAMDKLRGLNEYQMTEKALLVEMQKPINFPNLLIALFTRPEGPKDKPSLYVPNNFIYSTYLDSAFPATKDNIFLNRYLNLAFQNNSIIEYSYSGIAGYLGPQYGLGYYESPTDYIGEGIFIDYDSGKLMFNEKTSDIISVNPLEPLSPGVNVQSTFSAGGGDNCPPHKILYSGSYWTLDNYVTRITGEHYNFMYDRNRSKWIQIVDIDVSTLTGEINVSGKSIVAINTYWQGLDNSQANKNYLWDNGTDIRYNYRENRYAFFTNYADGSYVYPNDATHPPVIDIGVRLINATKLPDKGLTFCCPYPLYIKGDFNTDSSKPALIITDSLTLLPEDWQDWRSQMDFYQTYLWYDSTNETYKNQPRIRGTTIYADIITGRTHPKFWIQTPDTNQTQAPNPDMGFHDAFRSLTRMPYVILYGSLMLPYFCQEQWEPPINFAQHDVRAPHNYSYPTLAMCPRKDVGIPAAMPFYYRINRGRKMHYIGKTMYESLKSEVYEKDWASASKTFNEYWNALPNYLKYETAP